MKPNSHFKHFHHRSKQQFIHVLLFALLSQASHSNAASAKWNGTANALWSDTANWSASPVPGAADTATFDNAGNGNTTIDLGSGVAVKSIVFSNPAAAYTLGSGSAGSQTLTLQDNSSVTVNSTVSNPQSLNARVVLGHTGAAQTTTLTNSATTSLTLAGPVTGAVGSGIKTFNLVNTGDVTITGLISNDASGTVRLIKDGNNTTGKGKLTLTEANTYTGGTTVNNGILHLNHSADSLPAIKGNVSVNSFKNAANDRTAVLSLGANDQLESTAVVSLAIGGNNSNVSEFSLGGRTQTLAGITAGISSGSGGTTGRNIIENARIGETGLGNGVLTLNHSNDVTLGTAASAVRLEIRDGGSGTFSLVKDGEGTLSLNLYAASYSGGFTLKNGVVQIAGSNSIGSGVLTLQGGTFSSANATARSFNSNALKFDGNFTLGNLTNSGDLSFAGAASLTGDRQITIASAVNLTGVLSSSGGVFGFTKAGNGTLTLSGTNTYSGATTVVAGSLLIDGNQSAATGLVTVASGGLLGGTGTIGGDLLVNGKIAPGRSNGTFTALGAVTLEASSEISISPTDWSAQAGKLAAASLQINATAANLLVVRVNGAALANFTESAKTFLLATVTGEVAGLINTPGSKNYQVIASNFSTSPTGSWSLQVNGTNLELKYEPSVGFTAWVSGYSLVGSDATAAADADQDGLPNAIEFIVGGNPSSGNDAGKLPSIQKSVDGVDFVFRRTAAAASLNIVVEHSANLSGSWTSAIDGVNGVTVSTSAGFYGEGVDKVVVHLPTNDVRHFARLRVDVP